ncbi:hypothetical protein JM47_00460 [Ureaplasma diversum]|uniref:ABC transporter ATP-binding protein n=1 Tax=Ureaplasma diversum TaxID=42094 RepID=A0A0C5S174_9BACT|nr:ABC transporter ATP-binding protein [Ureaplasma diversum]AJQ45130.1 hypothetical protein JM47_00460 [Ureaplasma diversum]
MRAIWSVLTTRLRLIFLVIILLNLVQITITLVQPLILAQINRGSVNNSATTHDAIVQGVVLIVLAVAWIIVSLLNNWVTTYLEVMTVGLLRERIFHKTMSLSHADKQRFSQSTLLNICVNDIQKIAKCMVIILRPGFMGISYFIGSIIVLFAVAQNHWQIPVLVISITIATAIIYSLMAAINEKRWRKAKPAIDSLNNKLLENIYGIKVIRLFTLENQFLESSHKQWSEVIKRSMIPIRISALVISFLMLMIFSVSPLIIIVGATTKTLVSAEILSIMQAANMLVLGISILAFSINEIIQTKVSFMRVNEFFHHKELITYQGNKTITNGLIQFDNVSFSYENNPNHLVLKNISFTIHPNEIVGIVGTTGSGKSTLINLLMHRFIPNNGSIKIDDTLLKDIDIKNLRDWFSVNEQTPVLIKGTFYENILFGLNNINEQEINEAVELAQATKFINDPDNGIYGIVEQNAKNLSGGQKQRLALSRCLLRKSPALVLDDCTSALDTITEAKVFEGIRKQTYFKQQIIVGQRISNILDCDKIIVMDKGEIVSIGTSEQLLKDCEIFKAIYNEQLAVDR